MAKYQQYDEYKDSGIEWLGDIPNSWGVTHLKFVASIVGRIGFRGYTVDDIVDEGQGAIVLSPSNVDNDQFSLEKKSYLSWAKYFESPEIMVEENDILLVKTGSTFGKSTIVREVGEPMTINPQMVLIKKSSIDSRFLSYLFNSSLIKAKIEVSNTGSGMPTMTQENINNFPIPLPATKIDIKIANFLDHETAQIDTLIEKQQTLIQLLKEKRQAVISHAVTKGLNPDAPMKDSGVEWLGEVPEHWNVAGFKKYLNSIIDYRGKTPEKFDSGKFLVTARNIKKGEINYGASQEYVSEKEYPQVMSRGIPEIGDVLFTTEAPLGEVAQVDKTDIALAQRIIKFSGQNGILDNTYLKFYIMSNAFQDSLMTFATGSTALGIKSDRLSYLRQLIPPLKEQLLITEHIERNLKAFDVLMMKAEQAIQLMQERRTALISAAVTGKIDVRDWVASE